MGEGKEMGKVKEGDEYGVRKGRNAEGGGDGGVVSEICFFKQ